MAKRVKCPGCGMEMNPKDVQAQGSYRGTTYYFCSEDCKENFDANPEKYIKQPVTASE